MPTRSNIGIIKKSGEIETIYCHWCGNPEQNGCMLFNFYNTVEQVKELISKGYIRLLDKTISKSEFLDSITNANYESLETLINDRDRNYCIEYVYLFSELEKKWYFYNNHNLVKELKGLEEELEKLESEDKKTYIYKKVMVMATDWICIGELEKDQSLEEFLKKEYRRQLKLENPDEKNYELWTKYYREIIYDYGKIPESFIQLDDMWYADINTLHFAK